MKIKISNILIKSSDYTSNSLYNTPIIINEDNSVSIRTGVIDNQSKAGKALINRAIDEGHSVKESKAHIMGDFKLDKGVFTVYLYQDTPHPIEIQLHKAEQQYAIEAFIKHFFVSKEQFDKFKESAINTKTNIWENEKHKMEQRIQKLNGTVNISRDNKTYKMPVIDYLELMAHNNGFDNYKDMLENGCVVDGYEDITLDVLKNYKQFLENMITEEKEPEI